MPASIVAFSDLHLEYDVCVLNDSAVQDRIVEEVADLCGGAADLLILSGSEAGGLGLVVTGRRRRR